MRTHSGPHSFRPSLFILEGRDVPSATVDLTTAGSSGEINGALFQQADAQPTGTGVIQSFVRIQGTGVERGYNTDARGLQFDENSSPKFTRSLQLNDVPVVLVNGVAYRQFLLDINQKASAPLLSLDELKIFLGDKGNLKGYDTNTGKLAGLDAVYNMDAGANNSVLMNYSLNHGSGSGDVFVLIPNQLFQSATANPYVYLYSTFGQTAAANSGFEEWAVLPKTDTTALGSLSGKVYLDAYPNGYYNDNEPGIAGVTITLTGFDNQGHAVSLSTVTDANGNYSFLYLKPGTYTITETQPQNYDDGSETVGSLGGDVSQDIFMNIALTAGLNGVNYNFGELDGVPNS
jgi:hypothetical protein